MPTIFRLSTGARLLCRDCLLPLPTSSGSVSMPLSLVAVLSALEAGISASCRQLVSALRSFTPLSFDPVTNTTPCGRALFTGRGLGMFRRMVKFGSLGINFIGFTAISALRSRCRIQSLVRVPAHLWSAVSVPTALACVCLQYSIPAVILGVTVTFGVYDTMCLSVLVISLTASC